MNKPHAISNPAQDILWRKIAYSIGTDPEICIREPYEKNNTTIIEVVVEDGRRAPAIAGVLKDEYNLGTIQIKIGVIGPAGKPVFPPDVTGPGFSLQQMVETALFANPYFHEIIPDYRPEEPEQVLTAVFYPKVIRLWRDDLSAYYGYAHYVAEDLFAEVLRRRFTDGTVLHTATVPGRAFFLRTGSAPVKDRKPRMLYFNS
ncbi:MAG: hypothetical protein GX894_02550 [Clostridia bacterium]|nr:hypothetical protein [Clostridia bacterium]